MPGAEWRADPYPMPGHPANYGALLFEQAASRLGLHPFPTPVAINNLDHDGRSVRGDASEMENRSATRPRCSITATK